jgi:ClpA/ClpB-like protein
VLRQGVSAWYWNVAETHEAVRIYNKLAEDTPSVGCSGAELCPGLGCDWGSRVPDRPCRGRAGNGTLQDHGVTVALAGAPIDELSSLAAWIGSVWPVLWAGGWFLLSGAGRRDMFERFTDRARQVVVPAQEKARTLSHNYIGTEHILLGLIVEGEGVAPRALESLGISLAAARRQVEEITGRGECPPSLTMSMTATLKMALAGA